MAVNFCPDRLARIAEFYAIEVDRRRLPGAVALVVRRGQLVLHKAIGIQGPSETGRAAAPMALDSLFRIYSMTKPIVSVAAMMLVERGLLSLSDPVATYLPEFASVRVAADEQVRVLRVPRKAPTVQDLLRHTSGLTYEILGDEPIQRMYAQADLASRDRSNREFCKVLAGMPLMFEPGTTWEYSRASDVLGALVEVVSGQTLGAFLQSEIFKPLGMVDTAFAVSLDQQRRLADPFPVCPDSGAPVQLIDVRRPYAREAGGNGLVSTALDYARFLQCLQGGGALGQVRLLSPSTVRSMCSDHLGGMPQHISRVYGNMLRPGTTFGLGFCVRLTEGLDDVAGSAGLYFWGGSGGTTFFVDPAKELFAILLTQAPNQRERYVSVFRNMVYAALLD
jgi:CubicO group peptidase (beta-lactamase class C family)